MFKQLPVRRAQVGKIQLCIWGYETSALMTYLNLNVSNPMLILL